MSQRSERPIDMKVQFHSSTDNPNVQVASILGLDVHEACDGYRASELRSIARYLENLADQLDYADAAASTSPLWDKQ